jgi:hypothetical protein
MLAMKKTRLGNEENKTNDDKTPGAENNRTEEAVLWRNVDIWVDRYWESHEPARRCPFVTQPLGGSIAFDLD